MDPSRLIVEIYETGGLNFLRVAVNTHKVGAKSKQDWCIEFRGKPCENRKSTGLRYDQERTPGSPSPIKTDVLNVERHLVRIANPSRGI